MQTQQKEANSFTIEKENIPHDWSESRKVTTPGSTVTSNSPFLNKKKTNRFSLLEEQSYQMTGRRQRKHEMPRHHIHDLRSKFRFLSFQLHCVALDSVSGGNMLNLNFMFLDVLRSSISFADLTALLVLSSFIS